MNIPKWDSGLYLKTPVFSLLHFLLTAQVSHVSFKLPEKALLCTALRLLLFDTVSALSPWLQKPKGKAPA